MNLTEVLNTIALLLPGYAGAWAMSFIIGVRKREWSQVILYSLLFSAVSYFIVLRSAPSLSKLKWLNLTGYQEAVNQISNLGSKLYIVEFHNVIKVALFSMLICLFLGTLVGIFRRTETAKSIFLYFARRTQHADIWNDFHETAVVGPHTVILKDKSAYYGYIIMSSDTLTGNDRGIIMSSPLVVKDYSESLWTGSTAMSYVTEGWVLILSDQIASIQDTNKKVFVDRHKRNQRQKRNKTLWRRFLILSRKLSRQWGFNL